jgi:hypothetical protein
MLSEARQREARRPPRSVPVRRSRAARLAWASGAALAIAAGLAGLWMRSESAPLAMSQRWYVGTMGDADAAVAVAPEDRDLELVLEGAGSDDAALLVVDGAGRPIAPPLWFTRGTGGTGGVGGRLSLVAAPRTFAPHDGPAFGLAIVGARPAVERALRQEHDAGDVRTLRVELAPGGR